MRASSLPAVLAVASLLTAACGGSGSGSGSGAERDGTRSADSAATTLTHADGTIRVAGDGFELTADDGETIAFAYGPEVEPAQVRALEAARGEARVTWRPGDGKPVAAAVTAAPTLEEGLQTYEGAVVSVDTKEILIDGPDGERSFVIAVPEAFDVAHLLEHRQEGEPVVVHFRPGADGAGDEAVAYEDA